MATARTDDGILIDYVLDDFTNPWDEVTETIGICHGSTTNKTFYQPMVPYLARKYRVLRWDQRGRGLSTAPPEGQALSGPDKDVNLGERYARDALCLFDHLGIKQVHWAGDASGGSTGACFALMFPERISSLSCISSPLVKLNAEYVKAWSAGEKSPAAAIAKYGMAKYYEIVGTDWVTDPAKGSAKFQAWQREERKKIPTHVYVDHWIWQPETDLESQLPQIKVPTLLITGDKSGVSPLDQQRLQQRLIPNARLVVYENIGQGIAFLEPERIAKDILAFLEEVKST